MKGLEDFTNKILGQSEDQLVRKYRLSYPEAETLGPALLAYVLLAKELQLPSVLVTNVNLRDGLLTGNGQRARPGRKEFSKQIIRSAIDLGRKFEFDEQHAVHVAQLCSTLFQQLRDEHQLSPRYEVILYVAACLHEIGLFVSNRSYHKHSLYLIRNSELFGLGKKDLLLAALVARYHRRASPQPTHEGYATLDRDERVAVAKMAAILRVADALDESRSQRIHEVQVRARRGPPGDLDSAGRRPVAGDNSPSSRTGPSSKKPSARRCCCGWRGTNLVSSSSSSSSMRGRGSGSQHTRRCRKDRHRH